MRSDLEEATVPISWVWKALGVGIVAFPVIWWAATITANVGTISKAVQPIPKMQLDIATLLNRNESISKAH